MRTARKLVLLLVVAVGSMAFMASTAAAQIEVNDEATGNPCPEVTQDDDHLVDGGCETHVSTEDPMVFRNHVAGLGEVIFATCTVEFTLRIQASGHGLAHDITLGGGACGLEPCDEGVTHLNFAWIFSTSEFAGIPGSALTFCIRPATAAEGNSANECLIGQTIVVDNNHTYEFRSNGARCSNLPATSVTMHLAMDGQPIEIIH